MCIIDPEYYYDNAIKDLTNTRILASVCNNPYRQFTVYSNKVRLENDKPVAMILPVPNRELDPNNIRLIDTSQYTQPQDDIFLALRIMFEKSIESGAFLSAKSSDCDDSEPLLAVKECGSYLYSIVPSLTDFVRLDTNKLGGGRPKENVIKLLKDEYGTQKHEFSFIVCCLKSSDSEYHPIAYTHPMLPNSKLFVPTKHYHGDNHDRNPDWDHEIYVIGADVQDDFGISLNHGYFKPNQIPKHYIPYIISNNQLKSKHIRQKRIHGSQYPNIDIYVNSFIKLKQTRSN